jgi:hypothetical protein
MSAKNRSALRFGFASQRQDEREDYLPTGLYVIQSKCSGGKLVLPIKKID